VWTHAKNKDSLNEINTWSYGQLTKALDWLDACDQLEEKQARLQEKQMEQKSKR